MGKGYAVFCEFGVVGSLAGYNPEKLFVDGLPFKN